MEILMLDPAQIKIRDGLDRYRKDMGDLSKLGESIVRTRQILPVVITRDYELIDGGRRVAACMLKGIKVKAVFEDVTDDYEFRELEIEANLFRKDFTPAEEALAIRDLHELKQKRLGESTSGSTEGWSITKTAELLGKTRGTVYNALEMAALIDAFPDLKAAKKKSEIKKAGQALQKLDIILKGMKKHEDAARTNTKSYILLNEDAVGHMAKLESGSVDILLTDPLYGIGADLISQTVGGRTGGAFSSSGFKIEDPKEAAYYYYYILAQQSFRFCSNKAHGYVFVGPEHFWKIREIFLAAGWLVHVKPLIWIKREVGQCNVPHAWPASCYEMLIYIRRDESRLVREGMPDWLECPPVPSSQRRHPYEKPLPLLTNLLERVALPGQVLYDPFMGSGSSIKAGVDMKLFCTGVDVDKNAYAQALARMAEGEQNEQDGKNAEQQHEEAGV